MDFEHNKQKNKFCSRLKFKEILENFIQPASWMSIQKVHHLEGVSPNPLQFPWSKIREDYIVLRYDNMHMAGVTKIKIRFK